jgi:hypothetical protein
MAFVLEKSLGDPDDLCGNWWHHPFARNIAFWLHITAWEFMATALNVITFAPIVAGHPSYWYVDAISAVQTMIRSSTRSLAMQVIHELLI